MQEGIQSGVQEQLVFDRTKLRQTVTKEPLTGPQFAKMELEAKSRQT